jgi:hypothetical protein
MNKILILPFILFIAAGSVLGSAIVNNSASGTITPEDSLSMLLKSIDSLGNPVAADSFYLLVIGPKGDSVFSERGTNAGLGRIDSVRTGSVTTYIFKTQVSDIDGSGILGKYALQVYAKKNTPLYITLNILDFQITGAEFSDALDSAGLAARGGIFTTAQRDSIMAALTNNSVADKVWKADTTGRTSGLNWFGRLMKSSSGGNDSVSIARWVWNTPHGNHVNNGTFGRFLDVEVSSLAAGSGAWSFTVVAVDSAVDQAVPNAIVSIRNLEQTALVAVGTTNSLGRAWFNLNSGEYLTIIISPGYTFPAYDTIVVLGPGADTVLGYQFNPGGPASPSLCRLYGYLYGVNGLPVSAASIVASLPKGVMRTDQLVVAPFAVSTVTDAGGYFFLDLIPSDSLRPSGSTYEISVSRNDGTILRKRLTVPAQPNWRLTW